MVKMRKKILKRSLLFSFAMVFLAIVILMLAILIFRTSLESKERLLELGILDRVYDLDSSLQKSFRDIFQEAQIIVNVTNSSVSFEEDLPNNETSFPALMNNFKFFVEGNDEHIWLNLSDIINELPLVIKPFDITYKHLNFSGNKIVVLPAQINFEGYSVFVKVYENITGCPEYEEESENFSLFIGAIGTGELNCPLGQVDPEEENNITTVNGNIRIGGNSDGQLFITSENIIVTVKTKILLSPLPNEQIYVIYPPTIHIDFQDFKIAKRGNVRIK